MAIATEHIGERRGIRILAEVVVAVVLEEGVADAVDMMGLAVEVVVVTMVPAVEAVTDTENLPHLRSRDLTEVPRQRS